MSHHRVSVLSDIHGNYHALTSVLDDIQQQQIENIIVAGDSTGPLMQNQVFRTLTEQKATMIRGNGEKRIVRNNRGLVPDNVWKQTSYALNRWVYNDLNPAIKNLLEFLPDTRVIKYKDSTPIHVVHGSPNDTFNTQGILPELASTESRKLQLVFSIISLEEAVQDIEESVLICGHTHRPWVRSVDNILVINPGSVGNPCNGDPQADYAVIAWEDDRWSVEHKMVSYNLESVSNEFLESGLLETVGAAASATMLCRMTGVDVTLDFLLYVKDVQSEGSLNYEQAYSAASESFDWKKYE